MKRILLIISMFFIQSAVAQTESTITKNDAIVDAKELEIKPDFPGGINKFYQFVGQNFNVPEKGETSGKIFLTFIVETDGTLTNINVVRGINPAMNSEAIRVMKLSPKWNPGKIGNETVRAKYSIPISVN